VILCLNFVGHLVIEGHLASVSLDSEVSKCLSDGARL